MGMGFTVRLKDKAAKAGEILIYEDIGAGGWFNDGVSAKSFTDALKALGDVSTLDVRINSYGGDVFDGLTIYQQLVQSKAKVTTHIDGIAASIASVIAMAGEEIRIAEAGWMMIHDAWGMAAGNAKQLREMADRMDAVSKQLAGIYSARTKQKSDTVVAWMAEEKWFNAADAISAGFATTLAENLRMAAHAEPPTYFRCVPKDLRAPAAAPAAAATQGDADIRAALERNRKALEARRQNRYLMSRGAG